MLYDVDGTRFAWPSKLFFFKKIKSSKNDCFQERGVETKNLTGIYRNLQESTGIHRILQESTGNERKLKEMVEFHARLATRGRVYIPKVIVERWMLWRDTLIYVRVLLRGQLRSVEFDTRVRSGFCFVIPQNELKVLHAERGALLKVEISKG